MVVAKVVVNGLCVCVRVRMSFELIIRIFKLIQHQKINQYVVKKQGKMSLLHHRFKLNSLSINFYTFVDPLTCVVWVASKYFYIKYGDQFFKFSEFAEEATDVCLFKLKWAYLIDNYPEDQIEVPQGWEPDTIMISQSSVSKVFQSVKLNFCKLVDKWFKILCDSVISECGYKCSNGITDKNAPKQYIYIASTKFYSDEDIYIIGTILDLSTKIKKSNFGRLDFDKIFFICVSDLTPNYTEIMKVLRKRLEKNIIIDGSVESITNNEVFFVTLKKTTLYKVFSEVCGSFKKL